MKTSLFEPGFVRKAPDPEPRDFDLPHFNGEQVQPRVGDYVFVPFDVGDRKVVQTIEEAEREAGEIRARARAEAETIKQEAEKIKAEAEALRARAAEEGRTQGFQKGLAQGREEGRKKFETDAAPTLAALERLEDLYQDLWKINEAPLVKLAASIAERIVFQEVSTSPATIASAFKAALDQLHQQHQVVFRLNPADLANLELVSDEMKGRLKGLVKITFEPDPNLSRGDLIMETEAGRLDATVRRRIEAVLPAVEEVLVQSFDLNW
ncbi:MAG: FliH/SctL family protein [Thermodesulfobacteriota bacterium]